MSSPDASQKLRNLLLVSNEVMHYRVPVYNYFHSRFRELGFEFSVLTNSLQKDNLHKLDFECRVLPLRFRIYKAEILSRKPAAVILFLHLKDRIIWPLAHWLKLRRIPFAIWTKGGNWDERESRLRYWLFNYLHALSDALILYSAACREFVSARFHGKTFVANNTLNFEAFPQVPESKEEIKQDLGVQFERVVLFMGDMAAGNGRKKVDHLIEIFRALTRPDVGLVLVGPGLSAESQRRLNPGNSRYFGNVQDPEDRQISRFCKMADLCAIPGHAGLALNQALFWGLPVVTEEGCQPPEIAYLKPGLNGFIVPNGDLTAFAERMLYVLDNEDIRDRMSKNAAADIRKEAPPQLMFEGFRKCVERLTAG